MEEKIYEMEYTINGEKYLITATKVNEDLETTATSVCEEPCLNTENEPETFEFNDDVLVFNVKDIPDGMDIETWLSIVDMYGIILTK